MSHRRLWACLALSAFVAAPARAKVLFTGYADFQATPQSDSLITRGSDALLSSFGITRRRGEVRSFSMNSLGLFASTSFNDQADFLVDFTYKKIGSTTGETRLQYAYLHLHTPSLWEANVGRVTLPIGYYNRNYFYPFQRAAVTAPVYQSSIIGLPIADNGAVVSKTLDAGPVGFTVAAYVVNGYGPSKNKAGGASTDTFRAAVGSSDALLIANNLGAQDANSKPAYGGNARVMFLEHRVKLGLSSYQGAWSPDGKRMFTMLNAYLTVETDRATLLAEGLRTDTDDDKGVVKYFGASDWKSTGAFLEGSFVLMKKDDGSLSLFAGTEETVAQGKGAAASGRERLINHKTGFAWRLNPSVLLKLQGSLLYYQLPNQFGGGEEDIQIRQRQALLSMVLTY